MKDKLFGVLQRVGRSFMLPIAILPIAGLFLGVGESFTNQSMLEAYRLTGIMGEGTVIYTVLKILAASGNIVFGNLPLIFAIGIAIGMAKKEKEVAALSAAIAFLVMHAAIGALLSISGKVLVEGNTVTYAADVIDGSITSVVGIQSLQMGVFGGIIVGLGVAALHNRFYKIELPQVLSFFGGSRFVPIISSVVYLLVGIVMYFVWPMVQSIIFALGGLVRSSGYIGTWIYGITERALIPFGLHHVFYLPFWQTGVGGSEMIDGVLVQGAQNIFFAELASPSVTKFSVSATRFMSGKFPFMIFGLPGAALALYKCARSEKRKVVGGLLLSAALTAMLTGITEPIEFTFLFVAPVLYIIHCVLAGLAYMLMHIFNVGVGMTFSGGVIDLTLFGILPGLQKTNWIWVVVVGLVYFVVYYFLFTFMIKRYNLKTPGREEDNEETKLYTRADVNARKEAAKSASSDETSEYILKGLGGKSNISDLDCCATRLRITVKDPKKVIQDIIKKSGSAGIIVKGNGIQIIYGPKVTVIKSRLEAYMDSNEGNGVSEKYEIYSPIKGKTVPLSDLQDGVFSEKILGDGIAIEPEAGQIYAPCDGLIENVFDTKHAIGILTNDGINILIHVGIDTVNLKGKHFDLKVKVGDKIKKGDLLMNVDLVSVRKAGFKTVTPVIVCNTDEFPDISIAQSGDVDNGDVILEISK